ncbi:hypothetical protein VTI74DRAFT_158 [Chaetomium olivicolor]
MNGRLYLSATVWAALYARMPWLGQKSDRSHTSRISFYGPEASFSWGRHTTDLGLLTGPSGCLARSA